MTEPTADQVYDVLMNESGATEYWRESFRSWWEQVDVGRLGDEFRFCGSLGFGGKYRKGRNAVDCYQEDETKERRTTIKRTNEALAALKTNEIRTPPPTTAAGEPDDAEKGNK